MLNAFQPYNCEFCGEQNEVFVTHRARESEIHRRLPVCCRPNLLTIRIERDGGVCH
jgi:hypothetical protein